MASARRPTCTLLWLRVSVPLAVLLLVTAAISAGCTPSARPTTTSSDQTLSAAFSAHASGVEVTGSGVVVRVLADDNEGGRHQRFILRLASGQTLLVAHNIDVATRLAGPPIGAVVEFKGQFEYNAQGGVVHWTHRDPSGRHEPGWLKCAGRTYQ